jgi:predicted RNase H-like HicB family nuclease
MKQTAVPRRFTVYYQEEEEGGYSGRCAELPAAISQGETLEELKENMKDAIELVLESINDEEEQEQKKKMEIELLA